MPRKKSDVMLSGIDVEDEQDDTKEFVVGGGVIPLNNVQGNSVGKRNENSKTGKNKTNIRRAVIKRPPRDPVYEMGSLNGPGTKAKIRRDNPSWICDKHFEALPVTALAADQRRDSQHRQSA
jgi:hypothetical protein